MKLVLIAAFVAACGAAKLDRAYLPPASAVTAGGSPGSIQTPFAANSFNQGLGGIPKGSFTNDFDGVVVDAAAPGTRASEGGTGLGAPRLSYGSTNSKVGDAAFKGAAGFRQGNNQNANIDVPFDNQGAVSGFAQGSVSGFTQTSNGAPFEPKQERAQTAYDRVANTLRFESEVGPESYNFAYETDNGITAEENGVDANGNHAQGGYSYTGDDGQVYSVTYVADENGYQPRGDHLPTPPPIPEEILKSLEQNARDEAAGLIDDGSYDAQKYNAGADYAETDVTQVEQNDRQAPTFGKRPESDASVSGTFINQNNQAFVQPGSNEYVQEDMSGIQGFPNNVFQPTSSANAFSQFSQSNQQQANGFGSRIQSNNKQNVIANNKQTHNRLDVQSSIGHPSTINNKYQASISSDVSGQVTHSSDNRFGLMNEYLPPVRGQNGMPQRPISTPQRFGQASQNSQSTFQGTSPTRLTQSTQVSNGFLQKPQIPSSSSPQNGNRPFESRPFEEQRPTIQPSAELTTPFESSEQSSAVNDFPGRDTSLNFQKPTAQPVSQYENQQNREPASRPRPSLANQSQTFGQKPQYQGQYHTDRGEYVSSTVRPSFNQQQKQGPDSSYYYKQPAKPFTAPSTQDSKFPAASFSQFNRVTQQAQASAQVNGPSQQNFPFNSFQSQRQPSSSSARYPQQPAFAPINPTSFTGGQNQGSTTSSQYTGITQVSASSFPSQNQGSTRYPRPQTAAPTIPTNSIRGSSESNKITQATATAFVSTAPTSAANINAQSAFGRPTFPATENRFQATQSFSKPQSEHVSSEKESDISPSVATQQYSGEIYEYSKPAEMLPAPTRTESTASVQNQFESSQGNANEQKSEQPRPTFAAPSQSQGNIRPSYPQYNVQSSFNKERPTQTSQSNVQARPFESQSQLSSRPEIPNCCQSLDSQIARLESQRVQGARPVSSQFGSQFPGSNQGSSSFAAEEDTFSAHRKPPSFDEETGYHY